MTSFTRKQYPNAVIGARYPNAGIWLVRGTYPNAATWLVRDTYPNVVVWLVRDTYHSIRFKKKKKKKPGKGCSPPLQQWIWVLVHCRWHEQRGLVKSIPARFARDLWMINWRKVEVYHTSVLRKRLHWIVPVRRLSSSLDFFQTSDNLLPLNFLYNLSWFTWDAMDLFRHCLNAV